MSQALVPGTEIFVPNMTYEADYPLRGQESQLSGVWLQDLNIPYGNLSHYQNVPHLKHADFRLTSFKIFYLHINNQSLWMALQMRQHVSTGFWYATFAYISQLAFYVNLHRAVIGPSATLTGRWRPDIDLRRMLTGLKLSVEQTHIKVSLYCRKNRSVMYRLSWISEYPSPAEIEI